ncbi:MAG: 3,4-dihydroxy-2-butanone-4-phosphate synthase [Polyangiaceae bacterium]
MNMPHRAHSQPPRPLDIEPGPLEAVRQALDDIRAGKMVILVDDEDRENEGDLTMAADAITPEAINFMAKYGRGLICLTLTETQVERLELPMMQPPKGRAGPPLGTAFTVSIEAREGVTTGISAADRAHTVKVAIRPDVQPDDLVTPGHVFPLKARRGGVLVRAGQTEGSVDLARLAGLTPAGVICEIMNDDGTMARMPDLEAFAREHRLRIVTIADLIRYRLQNERLLERVSESEVVLDRTETTWRAIVYEATVEERQLLALVKGDVSVSEPVLVRMHSGSTLGDVFSSPASEGGRNLFEAVDAIEAAGRGVVVYLPPRGDLRAELEAVGRRSKSSPFNAPPADARPHGGTLREYGLGAQVLRELGVQRIRLLTNNPRKIAGIHGYGLEVVESVALLSNQSVRLS